MNINKYEEDSKDKLEVFNNFTNIAKDAVQTLISNIKDNIKQYEDIIDYTNKQITENQSSREKCEKEITRKSDAIERTKENIENIQNTYKKMVEAYSSTSVGGTKDIYSDIINGAKTSCDEQVKKCNEEITTMHADIEAIRNNISEFNRSVNSLNISLGRYRNELSKYRKSLDYMNDVAISFQNNLDSILNNVEPVKKGEARIIGNIPSGANIVVGNVEVGKSVEEFPSAFNGTNSSDISDVFASETFDLNDHKEDVDDSLKQIYDLTGYKPKDDNKKEDKKKPSEEKETKEEKEEKKEKKEKEPEKKEEKKEEEKEQKEEKKEKDKKDKEEVKHEVNSFEEDDISEWEKILNGADDMISNLTKVEYKEEKEEPKEEEKSEPKEEPKKKAPQTQEKNNDIETVNQLLKPYGTSFDKLKSLVSKEIKYKDGTTKEFKLEALDLIKVVNEIDGNDLKRMKVVGPEITLLKKIKAMKEGNK